MSILNLRFAAALKHLARRAAAGVRTGGARPHPYGSHVADFLAEREGAA